MEKYYNADTLLEFVKNNTPAINGHTTMKCVERAIKEAPTADVKEVKRGKWISASKKQGVHVGMKCSLCGARIKYSEYFNGNHNFCYKCGADMRGEEDE